MCSGGRRSGLLLCPVSVPDNLVCCVWLLAQAVAVAHAKFTKGRKLKWKQTQGALKKEFNMVIENSNHIKAKKVQSHSLQIASIRFQSLFRFRLQAHMRFCCRARLAQSKSRPLMCLCFERHSSRYPRRPAPVVPLGGGGGVPDLAEVLAENNKALVVALTAALVAAMAKTKPVVARKRASALLGALEVRHESFVLVVFWCLFSVVEIVACQVAGNSDDEDEASSDGDEADEVLKKEEKKVKKEEEQAAEKKAKAEAKKEAKEAKEKKKEEKKVDKEAKAKVVLVVDEKEKPKAATKITRKRAAAAEAEERKEEGGGMSKKVKAEDDDDDE